MGSDFQLGHSYPWPLQFLVPLTTHASSSTPGPPCLLEDRELARSLSNVWAELQGPDPSNQQSL